MDLSVKIAKGIASGMIHLHEEGIIHRDLAARNVLLNETYDAVVSDFGQSRKLGTDDVQATKSDTGPLKWMAVEGFTSRTYSKKSDVWSFGVTFWEIFTRAKEPWEGLEPVAAAFKVRDGERLPIPDHMPEALAHLMTSCWNSDPQLRPDFEKIHSILESFADSLNRPSLPSRNNLPPPLIPSGLQYNSHNALSRHPTGTKLSLPPLAMKPSAPPGMKPLSPPGSQIKPTPPSRPASNYASSEAFESSSKSPSSSVRRKLPNAPSVLVLPVLPPAKSTGPPSH